MLDGRRYAARDEWAADDATAPTDTPGAIIMRCNDEYPVSITGGLGVVCLASDARLNRSMALSSFAAGLPAMRPPAIGCGWRRRSPAASSTRESCRSTASARPWTERPFYAMRFIQGETLDAAIDRYHKEMAGASRSAEHDATMRTLLGHFVAVCKTVAYAHTRGIVHRDLKPANIMLGRFGETLVVDWGLASPRSVARGCVQGRLNELDDVSRSGSESPEASGDVVGTPAYMSPEQACGTASLQPSSDIYSLGATLYKLITGVPPLSGPLESMRTRVQCGDFRRPTELNKRASKALEAVCLKAMSLGTVRPLQRRWIWLRMSSGSWATRMSRPIANRRCVAARWARRHWAGVQVAARNWFLLLTTVASVATVALNRQARQESVLKMAAEVSRASEREFARQSLSASAKFASQVIANQVDIRWCILEKIANDTHSHAALQAVNADAQEESRRAPLQTWLDEMAAAHASLSFRSLHVNAEDGTQVAQHPSTDSEGRRMESLGQNFRYRDYFHGLHQQLPDDTETQPPPLTMPHVSAVIESTYAAESTVVFSVPVRVERASAPCGVLAMTVHLGGLAALDVGLPPAPQILLVDTRRYSVRRGFPNRTISAVKGWCCFMRRSPTCQDSARCPTLMTRPCNACSMSRSGSSLRAALRPWGTRCPAILLIPCRRIAADRTLRHVHR